MKRCQSLIPLQILVVGAMVAGGWPARAADAPEPPIYRAELSESHLQDETLYFNVLITGQKVGWMRETLQRRELDGEKVFALEIEFLQKLLNDGEEFETTSTDVEYFSTLPPYRFVGGSSTSAQNGFESATHIQPTAGAEGEFTARILGGATERKKDLGALDYSLGDALASLVWCEEKPAVGAAIRARELDFTDLEVRPAVFTITGLLPESGDGALELEGFTARYQMSYFDQVDKIRGEFTVDGSGRMLRGEIVGAVKFDLTTKDDAEKLEASLDLFESSLIRVAKPLGDPTEIREMILEITGPAIESIADSATQDASYDAAAKRVLLKVGGDHGTPAPVTAEERAEALEETSTYPTKDPAVLALVERALGKATRPKARIKRLVDFVDEFIADDYGNEPLSVNDIIDTQRGDCTEHSQLFVTMARAAGIPAREVSGFIYGEGADFSFGGHAWCEVEVDGHWHPVDPTWGETVINATHIRISGERPSSEEMELFMGGLQFRMLSVTDKHGKRQVFENPSASE